jgi:hypothetical protein
VANNYKELGSTGLTRFGGMISEEWLHELRGIRGVKIYREMRDNESIIGAFLFAVEMLLRQVEWRVDPQGDTAQDKEAAKFIEDCLQDMSGTWSETLSSILSMLPFGWSVMEVVYKKRADGRIGWQKWAHRAQETLYEWIYDESTESLVAMQQLAPPKYKITEIPMSKCLHFRLWTTKDNPEGRSILRNSYRSWYFKKHIEEIEGIGVERDLAGLPIMWIPPEIIAGETEEAQQAFMQYKKMVSNIRRDEQEGIIMPLAFDENGNKMYDLQLLSTGSKRQFDTSQIITRYEQRIAMTVLADFLLLGQSNVGSFALASSKTSLFATALGAILRVVKEELNNNAIPKLMALNDFQIEKYPLITNEDIETPDLGELGDYIQKLSGAGFTLFPDIELENHLLKAANLPTRTESATPVEAPKEAPTKPEAEDEEFKETMTKLLKMFEEEGGD